jgi:hypothetical protein
MNRQARNLLLLIVVSAAFGVAVWALLRFTALKRYAFPKTEIETVSGADADLWTRAIEKVKEARPETENTAIEVPAELRHYSDRHWFLATQVAEVQKFNVPSSQDFVDLAAMIARGEMVSVPAVTETYILYGVGAKADEGPFSRYEDDQSIGLYDDAQLRDAYSRIESQRSKFQSEISSLKTQSAGLKKSDRARQRELQKEITTRQQQLKSNDEEKALLDQFYGQPETRQKLIREYESLQALAKTFGGRSYNLELASDRYALKVNMLSSLRPPALKILEELARLYHDKFDRPLPVSSLVRPEQYQRTLRRSNRNAVLIDTPPHSTGLAFDIDYRYMSGAEQTFLMAELARMKIAGRIEVIRERAANYHVFAFIDGVRPSDDLITASLEEAGAPAEETNHASKTPAKATSKSGKKRQAKMDAKAKKKKKTSSKPKARRR